MSRDGSTIGRYRVTAALGEGGMGQVWAAEDPELGRRVALKVLPPEVADDPDRLARFKREARSIAALNHPNVVTIYSVEEAQDAASGATLQFITMELVDGTPLGELVESGGLPVERVVDLGFTLADAMAAAHRHGITHRDLKPDNVMLDREGRLKVLDFGLAKLAAGVMDDADATVTAEGRIMGTVAYMSPEQAQGHAVDPRSDVFSLGIILYELAAGVRPFRGDSNLSVLTAIMRDAPPSLSEVRPGFPPAVAAIVERCLAKSPDERYPDAGALRDALGELRPRSDSSLSLPRVEPVPSGAALERRRRLLVRGVAAAAALAVLVAAGAWWLHRRDRVRWARTEALPRIEELSGQATWLERGTTAWEAHELATEAARYLGDDPALERAWLRATGRIDITSTPPGARVRARAYTDDEGPWRDVGETPLEQVRFPYGASRVTVDLVGYEPVDDLVFSIGYRDFAWDFAMQPEGSLPEGMVFVPGATEPLKLPGIDHLEPRTTGDFLLDRYEVSNREYKRFVDAGGYDDPSYWIEPFVENGRPVSRAEALARFVDSSGRPGPAGWIVGDYPEGGDDLPVHGISWYEAAAYAAFAGKRLPTIYHWNQVAATWVSGEIVPRANFGGQGPHARGEGGAMHRYGAYDLAGNVREWCRNAAGEGDERFVLGGGWNDPGYAFNDAYAQSAWDRSSTNGVRCMRPVEEEDAALAGPVAMPFRDFTAETPVSDATFRVFLKQYEYDRTPLHAEILSRVETDDWVAERVEFDAAYGDERVLAWLFLPHTPPPHPTIILFPGSGAIHNRSSENPSTRRFAALVKSGRALMFPVYKGTFERGTELDSDYPEETVLYKDHVIWWAKDLARSIDYMETREDLDTSHLAYYGTSWGGMLGAILPAIEPRIKVNLLYVAGMLFQRALPEVDQINYVGRVTQPTLMVNGEYDFFFPVETAQRPLYELLGTPEKDKRYVVYPGSHAVPQSELVRELLDWLDTYQPR